MNIGVFGKISFIGIEDISKSVLHCSNVMRIGLGGRHSARDVVHFEFFVKRVEKRIWQRLKRPKVFDIIGKVTSPLAGRNLVNVMGLICIKSTFPTGNEDGLASASLSSEPAQAT